LWIETNDERGLKAALDWQTDKLTASVASRSLTQSFMLLVVLYCQILMEYFSFLVEASTFACLQICVAGHAWLTRDRQLTGQFSNLNFNRLA
jgi:hypothetical protein